MKERKEATADPDKIVASLEALRDEWRDFIPKKAVKEINNLLCHARKGCISDISVGSQTQKNENLHRHLRQYLSGRPLLGAESLVALLYTFFEEWNARLSGSTLLSVAASVACNHYFQIALSAFSDQFSLTRGLH